MSQNGNDAAEGLTSIPVSVNLGMCSTEHTPAHMSASVSGAAQTPPQVSVKTTSVDAHVRDIELEIQGGNSAGPWKQTPSDRLVAGGGLGRFDAAERV
jgi:hypothetical protein